jgi:hypothetical protein
MIHFFFDRFYSFPENPEHEPEQHQGQQNRQDHQPVIFQHGKKDFLFWKKFFQGGCLFCDQITMEEIAFPIFERDNSLTGDGQNVDKSGDSV